MFPSLRLLRTHPHRLGIGGIAVVVLALALAVLPLPVAAALGIALLGAPVLLAVPILGPLAAIASVPIQELVALPGGLTLTQVIVVAALGAWLLRVLAQPTRPLHLRWQWPWLAYLAWSLLTVLTARYSFALGMQQWARWLAAYLAFVLTLSLVVERQHAWWLLAALLIPPTWAALLGIQQFLTGYGPPSFRILGGRFARATSTFGKPNSYGGYLNMAWPLAAALTIFWLARARQHGRWLARPLVLGLALAGMTLTLLGGLFASYSRGGWIGAVGGGFAMLLLAGRRTATFALSALLLVLVIGLLGAFSALPPVVTERLAAITSNLRVFDAADVTVTDANFAVVERMAHWQAGWRMWQASPLVGVGPGNFNAAYLDFFVSRWTQSQGHAHNYYIHTLAENGLFGLGLYLLLFGLMLVQALRLWQRGRGTIWRAVAIGGCGIMIAVLGHNVFENLHVLNLGIQLSGVWAAQIVGLRLVDQ